MNKQIPIILAVLVCIMVATYGFGVPTVGGITQENVQPNGEHPANSSTPPADPMAFAGKAEFAETDTRRVSIGGDNSLPSATRASEDPAQNEPAVFQDGDKSWSYRKITSRGWTVYWENSLTQKETLFADLNKALDESFSHLESVIPVGALGFIKTIPIWVSDETTVPMRDGEKGVMLFHPGAQWLRDRGLNPHMAPGVHVVNPEALLYEHRIFDHQPMVVLHELAHAYHFIELTVENERVMNAHHNAVAKKLYRRVPDRRHPSVKTEAYAHTNSLEYFAELTEAYFGQNDWYPRNRQELKDHDPVGYAMIEDAWGVTTDETN